MQRLTPVPLQFLGQYMTRGTRALALLAGLAVGFGLAGESIAQTVNCTRLAAQIAAGPRGGGNGEKFARAAQRQQDEIDRTTAYANQLGCNNRRFLFFGADPPPQCGGIIAQIQRMRVNLQTLANQANAARTGASGQMQELVSLFNAECRANGFNQRRPLDGQQLPIEPAPFSEGVPGDRYDEAAPQRGRGGSKAICVRTCDGSFFPVSYSARGSNLDELADQCRALCPNADVKLFTMRGAGEIDEAVSTDGEAYSDLPNAFKYQKKVDASCSCRRAGQSWAEALVEAERVLGQSSRSDIVVTPQKADELAKPRLQGSAPPLAGGKTGARSTPSGAVAPEAAATVDTFIPGIGSPSADEAAAKFREITGKDGVKRRVRIVDPTRAAAQ